MDRRCRSPGASRHSPGNSFTIGRSNSSHRDRDPMVDMLKKNAAEKELERKRTEEAAKRLETEKLWRSKSLPKDKGLSTSVSLRVAHQSAQEKSGPD